MEPTVGPHVDYTTHDPLRAAICYCLYMRLGKPCSSMELVNQLRMTPSSQLGVSGFQPMNA